MNHILSRNSNQALGLARYAREFMEHGKPGDKVIKRVTLFHTDSVICGISALAMKTNAPTVLRNEALKIIGSKMTKRSLVTHKARLFGPDDWSTDVKAIVANCSAVREWDSNGTVFGYRAAVPELQAGEFGHNDFYPVVMAAVHQNPDIDGAKAVKAMILLDEIRGRLAESFSLKTYKIDHVVHGAIASIVTYGTLLNATEEQIESAIGMFVAHYIPFRAIRAGHQLSDSKGASAALSTEVAIMSLHRSMAGFVGPKDIFRNPQAIFRLFSKTETFESPFELHLGMEGDDFSVMGMHFKLGLYEHQSAGAIQGVIDILSKFRIHQEASLEDLQSIKIEIYEPAFGIIGDPHKRNPTTRQSADHSMVFIIASVIKKAFENAASMDKVVDKSDLWKHLILTPQDYSPAAIADPTLRRIMDLIEFEHGGDNYDREYPKGIPTSLTIKVGGTKYESPMVMFPAGHANARGFDLKGILHNKFEVLGRLAVGEKEVAKLIAKFSNLQRKGNGSMRELYKIPIEFSEESIDAPVKSA
jgi:2-methylcitrate dehydratase